MPIEDLSNLKDILIKVRYKFLATFSTFSGTPCKPLHAVPTLVCRGPSFYLKFLAKKGHNSKSIAFRVIPLVLQMHLVMMSKFSKFGFDNFYSF